MAKSCSNLAQILTREKSLFTFLLHGKFHFGGFNYYIPDEFRSMLPNLFACLRNANRTFVKDEQICGLNRILDR